MANGAHSLLQTKPAMTIRLSA